MISLRQFAKMAGVSPATVSRIFSGSDSVAPVTSTRIMELALACNFRPSVVRAASRRGGTRSIGVVMPSLDVSYFADIFRGIQQELFREKYLPILVDSSINPELDAVNRLVDHQVDGLILGLVRETLTPSAFKNILQLNLPLVITGSITAGLYGDVVDNDDVTGGRLALATVLLVSARAEAMLEPVRTVIGEAGGASVWTVGRSGKLLARLCAADGYDLRRRLVPLVRLLNGTAGLPKLWSL